MTATLRALVALIAGIMFGTGLAISGLLNPERVRGFLDITGEWDPTLAFVLISAVAVAALGNVVRRVMTRPVLDDTFHIPEGQGQIDQPLVVGSAIFGVGWAISGLCPGPVLASTGRDFSTIYALVLAMIAGVLIHSGQTPESDS